MRIPVTVRFRGDCYVARSGKGKTAKTASSTSGPHNAAKAVAAKVVSQFGLESGSLVTLSLLKPGGLYTPYEYEVVVGEGRAL